MRRSSVRARQLAPFSYDKRENIVNDRQVFWLTSDTPEKIDLWSVEPTYKDAKWESPSSFMSVMRNVPGDYDLKSGQKVAAKLQLTRSGKLWVSVDQSGGIFIGDAVPDWNDQEWEWDWMGQGMQINDSLGIEPKQSYPVKVVPIER